MDPIEDTREPREAEACEECGDTGEVEGQPEWDTGYYEMVTCPVCKGTRVASRDEYPDIEGREDR
jgi:hypothetical protein